VIKNILVATSSFKDVFSPIEAANMIKDTILESCANHEKLTIKTIPLIDGGEYSNETIFNELKCKKIKVKQVISPIGIAIESNYLALDKETAFIGSSEILRLLPEYDSYKNPLKLTSYGLGQLIMHALDNNYKKIIIGLGGTNTVDAGIGMAQALGMLFLDKNRKILLPKNGKYFCGEDLQNIDEIVDFDKFRYLNKLEIIVLCDSEIDILNMDIPTNLKISDTYNNTRKDILKKLSDGVFNYAQIISDKHKYRMPIEKMESYGVAGGAVLSITNIFNNIKLSSGINYFLKKFNVEDEIKKADIIITGEGRFDSLIVGKTPTGVSKLAKKNNKSVLLVCGDVDLPLKKYFTDYFCTNIPSHIKDLGISSIISCHEYYKDEDILNTYKEKILMYRVSTPKILEDPVCKYINTQN
jgi:glycerate 2-kinase